MPGPALVSSRIGAPPRNRGQLRCTMKAVISAKDIESLLAQGRDVQSLPDDAILTPSAKDLLRDLGRRGHGNASTSANASSRAAATALPAKPLSSKSPKAELDAFFNSDYCRNLKEQICDVGRRLWQRAYVDGNGGNIAIRVSSPDFPHGVAYTKHAEVSLEEMTIDNVVVTDIATPKNNAKLVNDTSLVERRG